MNIRRPRTRRWLAELGVFLATMASIHQSQAQSKKVRLAIPGYTIAVLSFFAAKTNGYFTAEGFEVELIAMRAPTANLALLGGNVEFSSVPMVGLTTALRGAPLKVLFCQNDKPQHVLFAKPDIQTVKALRSKKIAVAGPGIIDDILLREVLTANGIDAARDATILAVGAADTRLSALLSGAVDAAVLIAPFTFGAKEMGLKELVVFGDQGFVLPSGGIVIRDDSLRTDSATVERFVRATLMAFYFRVTIAAVPSKS
jgi:ABC-type nitrate/sulfonate/bicarbonate transport system substrate-binding protein